MPFRHITKSDEPWYNLLPDGEIEEKLEFDTNLWNRLLMTTVSISDFAVRTTAATAMVMASQQHINEIKSPENIERWKFYRDPKFFKKPKRFFKPPPKDIKIKAVAAAMPEFADAQVEDLTFDSPFEHVHPGYRPIVDHGKRPLSAARSIRHGDTTRPVIVCIHGFLFDDHALNSFIFGARGYYDLGYDLLLYTFTLSWALAR